MPIRSRRDRQLSQALERYLDDTLAAMPSEAELSTRYAFSPEFEARMSRLIQRARLEAGLPPIQPAAQEIGQANQKWQSSETDEPSRQADRLTYSFPSISDSSATRSPVRPGSRGMSGLPRRGKRLLLIAIILTILLSTFGLVAAREPIARFFVKMFDKFSWIVFSTPNESDAPSMPSGSTSNEPTITDGTGKSGESTIGSIGKSGTAASPDSPNKTGSSLRSGKMPTWIPDGYIEISRIETFDSLQIIFANPENDEITFERSVAGSISMIMDTEGLEAEKIIFSAIEGFYYSKMGRSHLVWQDGQYAYYLSGKLSKEGTINFANFTK